MRGSRVYTLLVGTLAIAFVSLLVPASAHAQEPGGDVSETLDVPTDETPSDLPAPATTPPARRPREPAPKPDTFEMRGFTRFTSGAGLHNLAPERPGAAPQERVPYDRAFAQQHLYLDLRYTHGSWFRAVASGSLSLAGYQQTNQPTDGPPASSVDVQAVDAVLREAYVAFTVGRLDLRLGQQRIAWGNSDAFTPNDVLNGRDLRNPFLFDPEMLVIPTLAARADLNLGLGVLGMVFEPFIPADKFDLYGTNWAIVQADAPRGYRRLFGTLARGQDRNSVLGVQNTLTNGALGSASLEPTVGASFKTQIGSVDLSWYVASGFDRQPAVFVDPAFQAQLERLEPDNVSAGVIDAVINQARASTRAAGGPVVISYRRRSHVGFDAQTAVGPFVLRTDVAYDSAKPFYAARTLNTTLRSTAQEVVGLEYQTGNLYKVIGLELWAQQFIGPEINYVPTIDAGTGGPLLFASPASYGSAGLFRWLAYDKIVFDTRATVGLRPFWWSVRPEIGWQEATFTVRVGVLALDGTDRGLGDWYRRNTTAYVTARVAF
jgi:hypothetical protein